MTEINVQCECPTTEICAAFGKWAEQMGWPGSCGIDSGDTWFILRTDGHTPEYYGSGCAQCPVKSTIVWTEMADLIKAGPPKKEPKPMTLDGEPFRFDGVRIWIPKNPYGFWIYRSKLAAIYRRAHGLPDDAVLVGLTREETEHLRETQTVNRRQCEAIVPKLTAALAESEGEK